MKPLTIYAHIHKYKNCNQTSCAILIKVSKKDLSVLMIFSFFSSDRVHATNILGLLPISRSAFPYTLLLVTKIVFFLFFLHYQSDHFDPTPVINTHEILVDTSYTQLPFTKGRQDSCFCLVQEELPKANIANNKLEKSIQTWFCSTMQSGNVFPKTWTVKQGIFWEGAEYNKLIFREE